MRECEKFAVPLKVKIAEAHGASHAQAMKNADKVPAEGAVESPNNAD